MLFQHGVLDMTDKTKRSAPAKITYIKQKDNKLKVNIEKNGVVRHAEILTCTDSVYKTLKSAPST